MDSSASDSPFQSPFPKISSPLTKYVYTADHAPATRNPGIQDVQIDPALLLEDQLFEQHLAAALTAEIARLDERNKPPSIRPGLSSVTELRIDQGGYGQEEESTSSGGRIRSKTLDDVTQNFPQANQQQFKIPRSSETPNADEKGSRSKGEMRLDFSVESTDDKGDPTVLTLTLHGKKRRYTVDHLIEGLSKHRKMD